MSGFMHSFTGEWDSLWFIGLFGLLVYFTMHTFTGDSPVESGIVSGLLVYLVYWFISPCVLALDSGIVSSLLVYLVYCPVEDLEGPKISILLS